MPRFTNVPDLWQQLEMLAELESYLWDTLTGLTTRMQLM